MTDAETSRPSPESSILPLFPLTGIVLLPGNFLPLNIFEQRYRNMVADALEGDRRIGMVQPLAPADDNAGPASERAALERPPVYEVGCVGRITRSEQQPDGRFLILLEGECRFRVTRELPLERGYRRAVTDVDEFSAADAADSLIGDELLPAALGFARRLDLDFDPDLLAALPLVRLVNVLAAALPFSAIEKQALLEAPTAEARQAMLLALMRMTPADGGVDSPHSTPIVH